jgi:precorrin-3B methylase
MAAAATAVVACYRAAVAESKRQVEQLRQLRNEHKKEDQTRLGLEKDVQQAVREVQVVSSSSSSNSSSSSSNSSSHPVFGSSC